MTIEQTKKAIPVMQAYVDGKEIEFRVSDSSETWRPITDSFWDWNNCEYRVKRQPFEGWTNVYIGYESCIYETLEVAKRNAASYCIRTIKVREVEE